MVFEHLYRRRSKMKGNQMLIERRLRHSRSPNYSTFRHKGAKSRPRRRNLIPHTYHRLLLPLTPHLQVKRKPVRLCNQQTAIVHLLHLDSSPFSPVFCRRLKAQARAPQTRKSSCETMSTPMQIRRPYPNCECPSRRG
jgi:hypothetical protein